MTRRRLAVSGLALLAVIAVVVSVGATGVVAQTTTNTTTTAPANTTATTTPTATTTTEQPEQPTGPPPIAEQARVSPVSMGADFMGTTVAEADRAFNTTGEFALFSVSEPVSAVRVVETPADATVLDGGRTIKVDYEPDAAPPGSTSLYHLEIFFQDGSKRAVRLYASETDQSVAAASLQEWSDVIDELQQFAADHGYDTDPESVSAYLTFINDRADLVEGFLTKQAARAVQWVIIGLRNPLVILTFLIGIAALMYRRQREFGDLLDALQKLAGRYEQKRDRLALDYQQAKRAADDDALSEVPEIGVYADYYEDAFGVKSPAQLTHLVAAGAMRRSDDGLERVHDGVEDLDIEDLRGSWLEPIFRHLPRERQVLNHLLAAVRWMETEHNLGHAYRPTRERLETLLDELERREENRDSTGSGVGGAAATGDD